MSKSKNTTSDRLKQDKRTEVITPKIHIDSITEYPLGTLFSVWHGTRNKDAVSPKQVEEVYNKFQSNSPTMKKKDREFAEEIVGLYPDLAGLEDASDLGEAYTHIVLSVAQKCIESDVPAGESVQLTIRIEDANVAWREQLLRSKIASYWTQSTRTMDMTTMDINMSKSVELLGGDEAVDIYKNTADVIRKAYSDLVELGVPVEDIRLQPQQHVHRVYWMISARALVKILNKRSDWIAQASLWLPIVAGITENLRGSNLFHVISPFLGEPLVEVGYNEDKGKYEVTKYIMNADNEDRYLGLDKLPCDPLWLAYKGYKGHPEHTDLDFYNYLKSMYIQIWGPEYLSVLGWDRQNPGAKGPYDDYATNSHPI